MDEQTKQELAFHVKDIYQYQAEMGNRLFNFSTSMIDINDGFLVNLKCDTSIGKLKDMMELYFKDVFPENLANYNRKGITSTNREIVLEYELIKLI